MVHEVQGHCRLLADVRPRLSPEAFQVEGRPPRLNEDKEEERKSSSRCKKCIFLKQSLPFPLTQGRGAEEDSSRRLPPSPTSSPVFHLLSLLHGSQLLARLVVVHQPGRVTERKWGTRGASVKHGGRGGAGAGGEIKRQSVYAETSTCQRRVSGRPSGGTPCRRRSSRRTSPPWNPRRAG